MMNHVVPKREVPVRIRLASGESRTGSVFLDFIDVIHRGAQTLLDKLNGESNWLPLRIGPGIEVLNRESVVLVEPGDGLDPALVRRATSAVVRRESVTVHLPSGTLEGLLAMDLPDEFSRVSDFLNFPEAFFALEMIEGPVLVAKRHISSLVPHEGPPAVPEPLGDRRSARS
jgi:hypothetical protein